MGESFLALGQLAQAMIRGRWIVLGTWLVLVIVFGCFAPGFINATTLSVVAPDGSESAYAQAKFDEYFPATANPAQFVGLLQATNVTSLSGLSNFTYALRDRLNASGDLTSFASYSTIGDMFKPLPGIGQQATANFVSKDSRSMLISWETSDDPLSKKAMDWAKSMVVTWDDLQHKWLGNDETLDLAGVYSMPQIINSALETAEKDLATMDGISLPLAGLVLMAVVGSGRLLLVPLACLASSAAVVFGLMRIIAYSTPVQSIAPPLMMSLLIAMSIDYSLFLLTRFREELEYASTSKAGENKGNARTQPLVDAEGTGSRPADVAGDLSRSTSQEHVHEAIKRTMTTSGATILVSGLTLTASFCFLALFPIALIASLGQGCALTMFVMLLVNLTLVPALLSTAPMFFARATANDRFGARCSRRVSRFCSCRCSATDADNRSSESKIWTAVAKITTSWPWNLVFFVVVAAGTLAVARAIMDLHVTNDASDAAARGTQLATVSDHLTSAFGPSQVYPYKLFMRPTSGSPIFGTAFYTAASGFLTAFEADVLKSFPEALGSTYTFLSYRSDGDGNVQNTTWDEIGMLCFTDPPPLGLSEKQRHDICGYQLQTFTNAADYRQNATMPPTATFGYINSGVDPLGHYGVSYLKAVRDACTKLGGAYDMECYVGGVPPLCLDVVTKVYAFFPGMIVATFAVSLLFMGLTFRSVLIPLRSLITNMLTLGFTYGLAVLVYQQGILNWTGWVAVSQFKEGMNYTLPVIMFFMITGICFDYDIFLLVRITEHRSEGMHPKTGIQKGLISTGGIITAAGIIMAVAFGGLLFSAISELNVMGFMMVVATLYDTFISRSIVNPALMSFMGRYNWWPSANFKSVSEPMGQARREDATIV